MYYSTLDHLDAIESGNFNLQKLKSEILARSHSKDWGAAKTEWTYKIKFQQEDPQSCLCGHAPITNICVIHNAMTKENAEIGSVCVQRFMHARPDLVKASIKRIRQNRERGLNKSAAEYFLENGALSQSDYDFSIETCRKRKLSPEQLKRRQSINEKVMAFVESEADVLG